MSLSAADVAAVREMIRAELRGADVNSLVRQLQGRLLSGTGSPENVVSASVGTLYARTDGGAGTVLYVKESGAAGPTGWQQK